jgi:demethylmenaquinone methyltransferase/2-methoxy-6-polyprenyl-1,4-benzoquinol methylase
MFNAVPNRYDLVNHVITWGLDTRWRQKAARECVAAKPRRVLDLCCGTGDLAIDIAHMAGKDTEITGIDFSRPMLELAGEKAAKAGAGDRLNLVHGDATSLPFPDEQFDCIGISFAFRNLTYKNRLRESCLEEIRRVLAPDGRLIILESSQPQSPVIRFLFHLYLKLFVAPIGHRLSGNREAYRYLAESMRRYFGPEEVKALLLQKDFSEVTYQPLLLGAAGIYTVTP